MQETLLHKAARKGEEDAVVWLLQRKDVDRKIKNVSLLH